MTTKRKAASKRELIEPHQGDKRYVRRKADGTFGKTVDQSSSLSADQETDSQSQGCKRSGRPRRSSRITERPLLQSASGRRRRYGLGSVVGPRNDPRAFTALVSCATRD